MRRTVWTENETQALVQFLHTSSVKNAIAQFMEWQGDNPRRSKLAVRGKALKLRKTEKQFDGFNLHTWANILDLPSVTLYRIPELPRAIDRAGLKELLQQRPQILKRCDPHALACLFGARFQYETLCQSLADKQEKQEQKRTKPSSPKVAKRTKPSSPKPKPKKRAKPSPSRPRPRGRVKPLPPSFDNIGGYTIQVETGEGFLSPAHAARWAGVPTADIVEAIRNGTIAGGCHWATEDGYDFRKPVLDAVRAERASGVTSTSELVERLREQFTPPEIRWAARMTGRAVPSRLRA